MSEIIDNIISAGEPIAQEQMKELVSLSLNEELFHRLKDARDKYEKIKKVVGDIRPYDYVWGIWCVKVEANVRLHIRKYPGVMATTWVSVYPEYGILRRKAYAFFEGSTIKVILSNLGRTNLSEKEIQERFPELGNHSFSLARLRTKTEIDFGYRKRRLPKNWDPFNYLYHYNAPIFRKSDKDPHLLGNHHHYEFTCESMIEARGKVENWYRYNIAPDDATLHHWVP